MRNLRIAVGYKTEHRSNQAVVLASGFDPVELQKAVNSAPLEFLRFELGVFHFARKARRDGPPSESLEVEDSLTDEDLQSIFAEVKTLTAERDGAKVQIDELVKSKESLQAELVKLADELRADRAMLETARADLAIANELLKPAKPESPAVDVEELAGRMYTAYCAGVGGKAFNGDALPAWLEFRADPSKALQSQAWIAAAAAATGTHSTPSTAETEPPVPGAESSSPSAPPPENAAPAPSPDLDDAPTISASGTESPKSRSRSRH